VHSYPGPFAHPHSNSTGVSLKRKCHLVKWSKICKDKRKGGLGVKDLKKLNVSLMCKWWWMLEHENGLWQEIVALKYIRDIHVCLIKPRASDSFIWTDLLKIRHIYRGSIS
jgi:hypothetical protein